MKKLVIEIRDDGTVTWGDGTSVGITVDDMYDASEFLENEAICASETM